MSKVKVKFIQLFNPLNIQQMNPELEKLIVFPTKRAGLKYDTNIKLNQAVAKAIKDFEEMRKKLCEENSRLKLINYVSGREEETFFTVAAPKEELKSPKEWEDRLIAKIDGVDVTDHKVLESRYDIVDTNEFQKLFGDLLETEIELECYTIKLSKLSEEDCSDLNFAMLEPFIEDDRS